jgi:predicted RNA-binding protein
MTEKEPILFCKNIQNVSVNPGDGKLTFTDIMGIPYESTGKIRSIDLVDNKIMIEEN